MNKKLIGLILAGVLSISFVGCSSSDTDTKKEDTTIQTSEEVKKVDEIVEEEVKDDYFMLGNGMFKVGTDLPAGEYLLITGGGSPSYYQVSKDSTGELASIVSNDNFSANRYITVSEGQYIQLRNCGLVNPDERELVIDNMLEDGMFKVGKDIPAGEYKVKANGSLGYVEVSSNSSGQLSSIVSNDNFEGEKYISVSDGQYLKLSNGTELILNQ